MTSSKTRDTTLDEDPPGDVRERLEPHLFLLLEGTRPSAGGARHALGGVDRVTLGRASSRSALRRVEPDGRVLALGLPDSRMSVRHACLTRGAYEGRFTVEDLGSTNGLRVNGYAVHKRVVLLDGDVLETGRTLFLYRARLPTTPSASADLDAADVRASRPELATLLPARAAMNEALRKIAASKVPVLVTGPTGSGKELVARGVHAESGRAGPFVAVNAAALPEALVESQMFGHVRGTFTGAFGSELGFVRSSDRGTLFLDEIADLALPAQAALLRVLQEGEVTPVGSSRAVPVDVRIVAATHADLDARCAAGAFREDLLARLAGFVFALPSLRNRREDLGLIVASILNRTPAVARELSADAARALALYPWPRNVRELQQALAAASVLAAPAGVVEPSHLPAAVAAMAAPRGAPPREADAESTADVELRGMLVALLVENRGNITEVARTMGKARMQIHRWVKRFDIDLDSLRRGAG